MIPAKVNMPSSRGREVVIGVLTLVLGGTAAGDMFVLLPRYRRFMEGVGVEPSLPARIALTASRVGLLFVLVAVGGAAAAWLLERRGRAGALSAYLAALSLLAAIYLALAACAFWDVMQLTERIH